MTAQPYTQEELANVLVAHGEAVVRVLEKPSMNRSAVDWAEFVMGRLLATVAERDERIKVAERVIGEQAVELEAREKAAPHVECACHPGVLWPVERWGKECSICAAEARVKELGATVRLRFDEEMKARAAHSRTLDVLAAAVEWMSEDGCDCGSDDPRCALCAAEAHLKENGR